MISCGSHGALPEDGAPDHGDGSTATIAKTTLTWFSIANWYIQAGELGIVMDGYLTRVPASNFHGGGGGLAFTNTAWPIDRPAVDRMIDTLRTAGSIDYIIIGHSHFDHAFDAAYWASQTGATVIGSKTTCLQMQAQNVPADRCIAVYGGERLELGRGVTMRVVRWNHSGDGSDPEQHDPVELQAPPIADANGEFRAGTSEDYPNGGGSRGYLFTIDTVGRPTSVYVQSTGSAFDLAADSITDGIDYGTPLDSLRAAMQDAALASVDLWIATGGSEIAQLVVPVIAPQTVVPSHWDGLYAPFDAGLPVRFENPGLASFLAARDIALLPQTEYMASYELDAAGVHQMIGEAVAPTTIAAPDDD